MKDTDVSPGPFQLINDYSDVYVFVKVTPDNGTAKKATSPVIADVMPQTVVLKDHELPVFTVPPRPVKVEWEVRDKDGDSYHVMAQGDEDNSE